MSNLNQKGPMGEGPMTGRKMGRCGNFGAGRRYITTQENENIENPMNDNTQGQGIGRGRGRGMGRGIKNGMGRNSGGRGMGQGGGGGRGMGRRFRGDSQE